MQGYSLSDTAPLVESGQNAGGEGREITSIGSTSVSTGSLNGTYWGDQPMIVVRPTG